ATQAGTNLGMGAAQATQTPQGKQSTQATQAGINLGMGAAQATQTPQGEQSTQATQAGSNHDMGAAQATQTPQGEQSTQATQAGTSLDMGAAQATQTPLGEQSTQATQANNTIPSKAIATQPAQGEQASQTAQMAALQQELNVFQRTIQGLKFAVEEADIEKQTLEAQNMELAERLAQLSQFVTYKAQSTKNATVDFGTWLTKQPMEK
ncbi:hypothetical protein DUNSADRAFT_16924, partial [Dunaliella salina]